MGEPSLSELEHDVEIARTKLARDLSTLRSPDTYARFSSALQQEAMTAKDALIDKAKVSVQSTVESFIEDVKAKAAANPAAALAIGAGIAWRLFQRPPIATALVGAGLFSLFRTQATYTNRRTTNDYLVEATGRLREQATDFAVELKDQAGRAVDAVTEQVTDITGAAKERVQEWGSQATATVQEAAHHLKEQTASVGRQATDQISELRESVVRAADNTGVAPRIDAFSRTVQAGAHDQGTRDSFLLGAASVAVIAALGIACQKRISESAQTE
jgi:hypothetical protein